MAGLRLVLCLFLCCTSAALAEEADTFSRVASYQFHDAIGAESNTPVMSRVVSYQYFDWPGDSNLTFQTSAQVSYRFDGPPVILQQPRNQIAVVGTNAAFLVVADGSAPLGYQWRFNGGYMPWENAESLSVTNVTLADAGDYSVVVWNSYGVATSAVGRLHVYLPPATPQPALPLMTNSTSLPPTNLTARPRVPSSDQMHVYTGGGTVDRNKMTIVLTHGFRSSSAEWPTGMAGVLIANGYESVANIVAWDWEDDAAGSYIELTRAASRTFRQGEALGNELIYVLGVNYDNNIHFIGHSLGTLLNCRAADFIHGDSKNNLFSRKFDPQNTHMTLFDQAELSSVYNAFMFSGYLLTAFTGGDEADTLDGLIHSPSWKKVIPDHSAWNDNYITAVGRKEDRAVNVLLFGNHSYPYHWYSNSVANPTLSPMGHRWSFERNSLGSAPSVGTCYRQETTSDPLSMNLIKVDDALVGPRLAA